MELPVCLFRVLLEHSGMALLAPALLDASVQLEHTGQEFHVSLSPTNVPLALFGTAMLVPLTQRNVLLELTGTERLARPSKVSVPSE